MRKECYYISHNTSILFIFSPPHSLWCVFAVCVYVYDAIIIIIAVLILWNYIIIVCMPSEFYCVLN
jgi:hypothetical protein